jgi:drug/metabolite transporter (DMT)-like permease
MTRHHTLTPRRWLVLIAIMLGASIGDSLLGIGMKQLGPVSLNHLGMLFLAFKSPWIIAGILVLIGFMACYMTALSWADITFVLPATAFGNVIVTLLSRFWLHEHVSTSRWLGVAFIVVGVGFVANGPSRTELIEAEVVP